MEPLPGKKTYLAALLMAAYAAGGMLTGFLDYPAGVQILLEAAAIFGLRLGIEKR